MTFSVNVANFAVTIAAGFTARIHTYSYIVVFSFVSASLPNLYVTVFLLHSSGFT